MGAITSLFSNVTKGDILRYLLMPQVVPRLESLYRAGFSRLAHIIAMVYRAVRILPANHVIFSRERRNDLKIMEVLGAAAGELKFDKAHMDKVVIYFLVLAGMILLLGQFVLMLGYMMMSPALAQAVALPTNYGQFFSTPQYQTDIAYRMLFSVFGVPDIFNPGAAGSNYHVGLHALFQFYSIGLLVVAVIIVCYYIFAVLVETAQTGVPFGKRYNHVWTPLRLVVALGLLIPMGYGLNAAQWITLYSAKFGSDFATQGWVRFNNVMTQEYLNNPTDRVGYPQSPNLMPLARFMMNVHACKQAYAMKYGSTIQILPWLVRDSAGSSSGPMLFSFNFQAAYNFVNKGDMIVRFGEYNATKYQKELGNVFPYCGELKIITSDIAEVGTLTMQSGYFAIVQHMWAGSGGTWPADLKKAGEDLVKDYYSSNNNWALWTASVPRDQFKASISTGLDTFLTNTIRNAVNNQANSPNWAKIQSDILNLGWAGAGMWYNKIAQINGSLVAGVNAYPYPTLQPSILEQMKKEQLQQNKENSGGVGDGLSNDKAMELNSVIDGNIGGALKYADDFWTNEDLEQGTYAGQVKATSNVFIDTINLIFGTRGLFNMCANANVHPLAQLSILGKGLVEASIRNLGLAFGFGALSVLPIPLLGAASGALSGILTSVASITMTMGFLLFYVLPFMPFLYFFFAVGSWIKGLFEAMVGVPLWALAHLRIDGDGLPGDAAMDGYYLIFEIFLRPILIVFGLLASVVIFGSMVKVLNDIYSLVVANLAGHDEGFTQLCGSVGNAQPGSAVAYFRGPVDELFYTILYAIIVYMIGMSCFKLIDLIPNNILRYMGSRAQTYNDSAQDPAEGLMFKLSIGSSQVTGKLIDIGRSGGQALGGIGKGIVEIATPPKNPQG